MLNPTQHTDTLKMDVPLYPHTCTVTASLNWCHCQVEIVYITASLALVRVPELISSVTLGHGAPDLELRFLSDSGVQAIPDAPKIPQPGPKRVILLKLRPASERMTPPST